LAQATCDLLEHDWEMAFMGKHVWVPAALVLFSLQGCGDYCNGSEAVKLCCTSSAITRTADGKTESRPYNTAQTAQTRDDPPRNKASCKDAIMDDAVRANPKVFDSWFTDKGVQIGSTEGRANEVPSEPTEEEEAQEVPSEPTEAQRQAKLDLVVTFQPDSDACSAHCHEHEPKDRNSDILFFGKDGTCTCGRLARWLGLAVPGECDGVCTGRAHCLPGVSICKSAHHSRSWYHDRGVTEDSCLCAGSLDTLPGPTREGCKATCEHETGDSEGAAYSIASVGGRIRKVHCSCKAPSEPTEDEEAEAVPSEPTEEEKAQFRALLRPPPAGNELDQKMTQWSKDMLKQKAKDRKAKDRKEAEKRRRIYMAKGAFAEASLQEMAAASAPVSQKHTTIVRQHE